MENEIDMETRDRTPVTVRESSHFDLEGKSKHLDEKLIDSGKSFHNQRKLENPPRHRDDREKPLENYSADKDTTSQPSSGRQQTETKSHHDSQLESLFSSSIDQELERKNNAATKKEESMRSKEESMSAKEGSANENSGNTTSMKYLSERADEMKDQNEDESNPGLLAKAKAIGSSIAGGAASLYHQGHTELETQRIKDDSDSTKHETKDSEDSWSDRIQQTGEQVKEKAQDLAEQGREKIESFTQSTDEPKSSQEEKPHGVISGIADYLSETTGLVGNWLSGAKSPREDKDEGEHPVISDSLREGRIEMAE